jgi:hypothetical protein
VGAYPLGSVFRQGSGPGQRGIEYSQAGCDEDESQEVVVRGWHNECDANENTRGVEDVYETWGQEEDEEQDMQWQAGQEAMRSQLFDLEASIALRCAQLNNGSCNGAHHNHKATVAGSSAGSSRSTFDHGPHHHPTAAAQQQGSSISKHQAAGRGRDVSTTCKGDVTLTVKGVQTYFRDTGRVESELAGVGGFGDVYVTTRLLPGLGFPVAVKKLRLLKNNPEVGGERTRENSL